MKVIAIAAVDRNGLIGKDSELPWNIPEDMKFFKDATREQIVIMGRKTYDSLGKALPKRENAVITRDLKWHASDARVFNDLLSAIQYFKGNLALQDKTIFIIGGAEIYSLSVPYLDEIWLTEIDAEFEGNVYFPFYRNGCLELASFTRVSSRPQSDLHEGSVRYVFSTYLKKS